MLVWTVNGKLVKHRDSQYRINWDRKAPSKGSQALKDFLLVNCKNHILYEEYRLPRCRLRVDFLDATKKIGYEFNGQQHITFSSFFHNDRNGFGASIRRDMSKIDFLEKNGYSVVELYDEDLDFLSYKFFKEKFNIEIY